MRDPGSRRTARWPAHTWLIGILSHKVIDHLRRSHLPASSSVDADEADLLEAPTRSPDRVLEQQHTVDIIEACCRGPKKDNLPQPWRRARELLARRIRRAGRRRGSVRPTCVNGSPAASRLSLQETFEGATPRIVGLAPIRSTPEGSCAERLIHRVPGDSGSRRRARATALPYWPQEEPHASPRPSRPSSRVTIQIDAVLYALQGYSYWLGVAPAPHWHVVPGSASGILPPFGLPTGLEGACTQPIGRRAVLPLRRNNSGLYFALHLGLFEFTYTRPDSPGALTGIDQIMIVPAVGYRWFPTSTGFYIAPFIAAGIAMYSIGDAKIGTETLPSHRVSLLPGFYVGWEWGRAAQR